MERMWQERADYGHFFYRIPNGESAADAYDRVSGFNESMWRLFGEEDFPSVCVLVTHGLMTRVFLMKWYVLCGCSDFRSYYSRTVWVLSFQSSSGTLRRVCCTQCSRSPNIFITLLWMLQSKVNEMLISTQVPLVCRVL